MPNTKILVEVASNSYVEIGFVYGVEQVCTYHKYVDIAAVGIETGAAWQRLWVAGTDGHRVVEVVEDVGNELNWAVSETRTL